MTDLVRASSRALIAVVVLTVFGCTADGPTSVDTLGSPTTTHCVPSLGPLVDAVDVDVIGDLTSEDAATVEWVLGRFQLAGLLLPAEIEVAFDPAKASCSGFLGRCTPPNGRAGATVCEPEGDTFHRILDRRITLLHELAHLWHWGRGDGEAWPDDSGIVGGRTGRLAEDGSLRSWDERSEERVAVAISWGLLDQTRRPVSTDFSCRELYEQFEALTGHPPIGPIEPSCRPDLR